MIGLAIHAYLLNVAKVAFDKYGVDFYEAINIAECIVNDLKPEKIEEWAQKVHAISEGEL